MITKQKKFKLLFAVCIMQLVIASTAFAKDKVYAITAYGAVADGKTDNTQAIQKAMNTASESGGGIVLVPKGNFVTGVIYLRSNVNLHFEKGGALLATTKRIDYGPESGLAPLGWAQWPDAAVQEC